MPEQDPITRLRQVEVGLGRLSDELAELLDTKPLNLLYWQQELRDAISALENAQASEAQDPGRRE
jgi:hypothetical protein